MKKFWLVLVCVVIVALSLTLYLFWEDYFKVKPQDQKVSSISEITGFGRPFSVIKSKSGLLYVSDFEPAQVRIVDKDNKFLKSIGSAGSGNGQFKMPHAVDFDGEGNIFVTDYGNKRVQKFSSSGEFISLTNNPRLTGPATSYFDQDYNLYVSDFGSGSLVKFSKDFDFLGFLGAKTDGTITSGWETEGEAVKSAEVGGFERIHSARVDKDGTIYVIDSGNNRVQRFSSDGRFAGWIGAKADGTLTNGWETEGSASMTDLPGGFSTPIALDFAGDDKLAVLEYANPRVQLFSKKDGKFIGWFGAKESGGLTVGWETEDRAREGSALGEIKLAYDLRIYDNKMYIADTGNHRVQIIEFESKF